MGTVSDLVAALHELTNEKKGKPANTIKDFNLLLNSRDQEFSNNVSKTLDAFQPTTSLGKLLKLKLIGRYKVSSNVWTLLQRGDTLQIKQVLKFDWFFKDVEDPTTFARNVIPNLSLSTRLKIINRYAVYLENNAAGEEIYKGLKSRYGIKSAIPLLPACGAEFVQNELINLTVLLPSSVLMLLLAKHRPIATEYIKFLVSDESSRKQHNLDPYKCVFEQLSRTDPETFIDLLLNHRSRFPSMTLGRRPLKKAIGNHFNQISKCFDNRHRVFNEKRFIRRLSLDQIKKLYVSSILPPTSMEFFNMDEFSDPFFFLTYVNPSVRSDILISTFQAKYNKNCLSRDLLHKFKLVGLKYLPKEAKIDWVNLKVPEMDCVQDEAEAIAHLPVETSMPRLKQIITAQSDATVRAAVAKLMVQTLNLNQCYNGIRDLVEFFVTRFRNETKGFRQTVVSEMGLLGDLFLKMDWEDWSAIHDFIDLINLNDEVPTCHGGLRSIYSQQIHACFLKGLDLDPYLRSYVEFEQRAEEPVRPCIVEMGQGTLYHKQCLEWYLKEFPTLGITSTLNKNFSIVLINLMDSLVEYNEKHKQSNIEIPDWLVMEMERLVSSDAIDEYNVFQIFEILTRNNDFELHDRLQLKHFPKYTNPNVLCRFLKKRPEVILSNLDSLMNNILMTYEYDPWKYNSFIKRCRLYDDIRAEMVKVSLATLGQAARTDKSDYSEQMRMKRNAINVLTELMEPSTYLEFCLSRVPISKEIKRDFAGNEMNRAVLRAIYKSLKRISTPLETLPVLRKFSSRSSSKTLCCSATGVCVRIPETIILSILNEWVECHVSLRKQILSLMYKIAPVEYSIMTFEQLFKAEKKMSLRLVLFLQIRDRFFVEPSDESYDTFISIVQQLTEDDRIIIFKLLDIYNVQDAYVSQYIELIWQLIDSKWAKVLEHGKSKIVEKVDKKVIKMLSNSVCDMLLAHELSLKLPKQSLSMYVYTYLLYSSSDEVQNHRLHAFMAALEPYVRTLWNECERLSSGPVFVVRHSMSNIVCSLCNESLNTENDARAASVLSSMKKAMLELLELRETLRECLLLDAYSLYLNLRGLGEESTYASALAELYNNYVEQFDSEFGYSLMRNLYSMDISKLVCKTKLAHELLKNHTHPSCHILATKMLSNTLVEEYDVSLYKAIIEVLSTSCHPHVQVAATDYFRSLIVTDVKL